VDDYPAPVQRGESVTIACLRVSQLHDFGAFSACGGQIDPGHNSRYFNELAAEKLIYLCRGK
jgi:hypothetical protein